MTVKDFPVPVPQTRRLLFKFEFKGFTQKSLVCLMMFPRSHNSVERSNQSRDSRGLSDENYLSHKKHIDSVGKTRKKEASGTPSPAKFDIIKHNSIVLKTPESNSTLINPDRLNRAAKAILDRNREIQDWNTNSRDDEIEASINNDELYLDTSTKYECVELLRLAAKFIFPLPSRCFTL